MLLEEDLYKETRVSGVYSRPSSCRETSYQPPALDMVDFNTHIGRGAMCRAVSATHLFDEAEQFGFDVMSGELSRKLLGALTVTGLRENLVDGMLDSLGSRLAGEQIDSCTGPLNMSRDFSLIFGKTGRDDRNAVRDCHVYSAVAPIGDEQVDLRHDLCVGQE